MLLDLNCSGHASVKHPAEIATVNIEVSTREDDSETAMRNVTETANKIIKEIKSPAQQYNAGVKKYHLQKLTTYEKREVEPGQRGVHHEELKHRVYYCASTNITVQYEDFDAMADTMWHFAKMKHVSIKGVNWSLCPETAAKSQGKLRKEATQDAIQRARDYFHAAEVDTFHLIHLNDDSAPASRYGDIEPLSAEESAGASNTPTLSFEPEDIQIAVNVSTSFQAEAPTLH